MILFMTLKVIFMMTRAVESTATYLMHSLRYFFLGFIC